MSIGVTGGPTNHSNKNEKGHQCAYRPFGKVEETMIFGYKQANEILPYFGENGS
jgi:hypothetical protein